MTIYSVNTLMEESRQLAANYYQTTGTPLPITTELSKFDTQKLLNFSPPSSISSGVDLIGTNKWKDLKVQVKSRVIFDNPKAKPMVGQINPAGKWDIIVLVLYDPDYVPGEILLATREQIEDAILNKRNNKRGSISVAKFKSISELVWVREENEQSSAS